MNLPANIELVAVLSGAACVTGLVLAVVALVGTTRPPGPPTGSGRWLRRLWLGAGSSRREQRAHQTLLAVLDQTRTPMGERLLKTWLTQGLRDATDHSDTSKAYY